MASASWRATAAASRHRVAAIEGHPCGQFSYPTIQLVPDRGAVLVAYTVLFLPATMPNDCKARRPHPGEPLIGKAAFCL